MALFSKSRHHLSERASGYIAGIAAACFYGSNPLFAVPLFALGVSSSTMLSYRYGIAAAILAAVMAIQRKGFGLRARQVIPMAFFAILFGLSSLCLFESYRFMDVGIASTLLFVYPVMVAVINAVCFRERLSPSATAAIVMAMSGIALLYFGGDPSGSLSVRGTLLVVASALFYAVYMVAVNRTTLRSVDPVALTFYSVLFGQLVYLTPILFGASFTPLHGAYPWILVTGLALFPTLISLLTMAFSIQKVGSTATAIMGALEPVTALAIGIGLFGERLTPCASTGALLVLAAVIVLISGERIWRLLRRRMLHRR